MGLLLRCRSVWRGQRREDLSVDTKAPERRWNVKGLESVCEEVRSASRLTPGGLKGAYRVPRITPRVSAPRANPLPLHCLLGPKTQALGQR